MLEYQDFLKAEFHRRRTKNATYSMRAFARDIAVSQPFLSQLLTKKRKLSAEKAEEVASSLKLNRAKRKLFVNLVRLDLAKSDSARIHLQKDVDDILKRQPIFTRLQEDVFTIIADWQHFAILELTTIEGFKSDVSWISRALQIPSPEVEASIERLKKVGLLIEVEGRFVKTERDYLFEKVPTSAIRKHHRQTLELAASALIHQDAKEREFYTISFAMDPSKIQIAKDRIREFSHSLMSELEETKPVGLYKLAVQFFRLDHNQKAVRKNA